MELTPRKSFTLKPKAIRLNPVGSFYNFPNWRYLILTEPRRAGLEHCRRKLDSGTGALKRYIKRDPVVKERPTSKPPALVENTVQAVLVPFSFSDDMLKMLGELNYQQKELFLKLYEKRLKDTDTKKILCEIKEGSEEDRYWNPKQIAHVSDLPLKRILTHAVHITYDRDIDFALSFFDSVEHSRIFRHIGYAIYAGAQDTQLAKQFRFRIGQIRALRELFFDFTCAPTDPIARIAYFTQLSDNKQISDEDRRFYKLVSELGDLGLRAFAGMTHLSVEERRCVEDHLAATMLDNILGINFAVSDLKDAVGYNSVINNLATFHIKREESAYFRSKVRNLDATTARILNAGDDKEADLTSEDEKAFALITKLALRENKMPEYRTINMLTE